MDDYDIVFKVLEERRAEGWDEDREEEEALHAIAALDRIDNLLRECREALEPFANINPNASMLGRQTVSRRMIEAARAVVEKL